VPKRLTDLSAVKLELADKKIELVDVKDLRFDPKNPRLPSNIDGTDERQVFIWMLAEGNIPELMASIGAAGYFPGEPLLVVPGKRKGSFDVIEGNRRLTAIKLLLAPRLAPTRVKAVQLVSDEAVYKPDRIPVIKYTSRDELLDFLAYRHITGVKAWEPLAKARYLGHMFTNLTKSTKLGMEAKFRRLAKQIGSRADYVERLLTGLWLFEIIDENSFFKIKELDENTIDFGILTTALTYGNIAKFLQLPERVTPDLKGLNVDHLRQFTMWLFERDDEGQTRLGDSRNLKNLNAVLGNEGAQEAFLAGKSLDDALRLTEQPGQIFRGALINARSAMRLARDYMHFVRKPTIEFELLDEIELITEGVRGALKAYAEKGRGPR
jgi:ParB-like nuclease domain